MKIWGVVLSLLLLFMAASVPLSLLAATENGGFEIGNLSGWTLNPANTGTVKIETLLPVIDGSGHTVATYSAREGTYLAALYSGADLEYNYYTTSLLKSVTAIASNKVSGWALFIAEEPDYFVDNGQPYYNDYGKVVIKNSTGDVVATLFDASIQSVGGVMGASSGWTKWEYTFSAPGNYTVEALIVEDTWASGASILAIDAVDITGPELPTAFAGGPYSVDEGHSIALSGTGTDPYGGTVTYSWDLNNDGTFETAGQTPTFSAANIAGPDNRNVVLKVTTSSGSYATSQASVIINNIVPVVNPGLDAEVASGAYFHANGTIIHPDTTVCTVTADWGDGSAIAELFRGTPSGGGATFIMHHQYVLPAGVESRVYNVTVTGNDGRGGVSSGIVHINVITPAGPPAFEPVIFPSVVVTGQQVRFNVIAEDPRQLPVTITASGLPSGAVFTSSGQITGEPRYMSTFTWTPLCSDVSVTPYRIDFTATSASRLTCTMNIFITVKPAPPVANAGGPYNIYLGNGVTLNASASSTNASSCGVTLVKYEWDLNGDGQYTERIGVLSALSAADMVGLGFTNYGHAYPVSVKVTDSLGLTATASTTLTITALTITASAGTGGTISPAGPVVVNYNASQTFVIAPTVGYHTTDVVVDGSSNGILTSYTFNNITANHTISASFAINTYTITTSAGANGSITPPGTVTVNHGASQQFSFTPNANYHVAEVVVDGASVGAPVTYSFNNITGNHTITVSFAINTYTMTATSGPNGTIAPPGVTSVNHGTNLTYTITANQNFFVLDVAVDGASVGAVTTYTFSNITSNHTITASFAPNKVVYLINATSGANGTITPAGIVSVNEGDNQTFTIIPNAGYHIQNVVVDSVSQGVLTSYTFTNVTANHAISASFAINTYNITASTGANGSISPGGAVIVNHGASQTFTITPNLGYQVGGVVIDGNSAGAIFTYTFNNVIANHTITASFVQASYSLTVNVDGSGSVVKTPDQTSYPTGTVVSLKAEPVAGWKFDRWEGALSGSANPASITMDANKAVTAVFTRQVITLDSFLIKHLHINWDKINARDNDDDDDCDNGCRAKYDEYINQKEKYGENHKNTQSKYIEYLKSREDCEDDASFNEKDSKNCQSKWTEYLQFVKKYGENNKKTLDKFKEYLKYQETCRVKCPPPAPKPPKNPGTSTSADFHVYGRMKLPEGMKYSDFQQSAVVTMTISNGIISDDVTFKKIGSVWQYKGNDGLPGLGLNVEKMSFWWAPENGNWSGMAGFHISGEFKMPEGVTGTIQPPEVTVSIKLETKAGLDVLGGAKVLCDVSGQGSVWQYNAHAGWAQFPFDIANEDD